MSSVIGQWSRGQVLLVSGHVVKCYWSVVTWSSVTGQWSRGQVLLVSSHVVKCYWSVVM